MNSPAENYEYLKKKSTEAGASLFGVADISGRRDQFNIYPRELLDDLDRAVCLGYHLSDLVMESITDRPGKLYYRHYKMANIYLDQLALRVGEEIQRIGFNYLPIPASQLIEWNGLSAHGSHRAVGHLAGLGWRGRSSLLVNPKFGARVRYVTLLTDMPLKADSPMENRCGSCRACVDACPAGAITMEGYDVEKCRKLLEHFGKTLHVSLICGVCQKVCRPRKQTEVNNI